jgi:hypothetical protein
LQAISNVAFGAATTTRPTLCDDRRPCATTKHIRYGARRPLIRLTMIMMIATTSRMWMKPPNVYEVINPSSQSTTKHDSQCIEHEIQPFFVR